ncbi:MAG: radical SAM protein [Alphaproteobacteria bacterium]|nr:radical SAM protein [Alphaproteobacteria bacterium]
MTHPTPDPRWLQRRQALHDDFDRVCTPPDASWLAYLGRHREILSLDDLAGLWRTAAAPPGDRAAINHVYVHVPFCKSICSFCNYERLRPRSPDLLRAWEARLVHTVETLAPALRDVTFSTLYFGGGTPSVLPADQLRRVVAVLEQHLRLDDAMSRYLELDPAMMSDSRVAALRDLGFSHLSFGIQTLDAAVNAAHDRGAQGRELVGKRFDDLRAAGIHDVSCDFLLGLAGTTVDQILAELDETLSRWAPVWVDVFQLVPTQGYLDRHFGGSRAAFDAHMQPFLDRGPDGVRRIAATHGYRLNDGQGHAISLYKHNEQPTVDPRTGRHLPEGPTAYSQQACEQDAPLNLLGLGTSARTQIFGGAWAEYRDPGDDIAADGPTRFLGSRISLVDEALMWLVHDLRDRDHTDRARFHSVFGRDVEALFPGAVAAWRAQGLLARDDAGGLSLVPQDRAARIRALLWLVPEERLEWELARRVGLDLSPDGLAERLSPLGPGAEVEGWTLTGTSASHLHLSRDGLALRLRVRPDADGGPPRLVVADPVPQDAHAVATLRAAARLLRRALGPSRREPR